MGLTINHLKLYWLFKRIWFQIKLDHLVDDICRGSSRMMVDIFCWQVWYRRWRRIIHEFGTPMWKPSPWHAVDVPHVGEQTPRCCHTQFQRAKQPNQSPINLCLTLTTPQVYASFVGESDPQPFAFCWSPVTGLWRRVRGNVSLCGGLRWIHSALSLSPADAARGNPEFGRETGW